ncbi:MAG: membrane lipoprotein lipid attachment site-containing protein [Chryseobacterium sp.]|uniref:membrane lipoprotein lipid attachment site-containing protein n=1 Tax=Chryseobacterium sp. TaxID=1871047 RepID=UPI0025B8AD95|nr:membrane lipoprotein lipid attachment site-containing protein [Chryseobacterium sp.]MCJ7935236.1 membrane lipoprotein lipid attachment site-containing protein [Chryseobacterium sp.]
MKKILFVFLSLFMLASCGSDSNRDNDNGTPNNVTAAPKVVTGTPIIANAQFKFAGTVTSAGSGYSRRGFCWSKSINPTISNSKYIEEYTNTTGDYLLMATYSTDFEKSTTYYVRAYVAAYNGDIIYGDNISFITPAKMDITFKMAKNVYTTSATLVTENIAVNYLEAFYPDEKGFCYRTSTGVDISNGQVIKISNPGNYSAYELEATALLPNTTYYVKSYVKEGAKVYYSAEKTFKTAGAIGASGGYIFYDKGEFTDGWRYLEAAPNNLLYSGSDKIRWGCPFDIVNQTQAVMGSGPANTARIISQCGDANCAARLCKNYSVNGLADWFLPSEEELMAFYKSSKNVYNIASNPWNDVSQKYYWSSTEVPGSNRARILDGYAGYMWDYTKDYNMVRVRPFRRF